MKRKYKPWITDKILRKIVIKNRILKKIIKCKNPDQKSQLNVQFNVLKNEITALTRESKNQYHETFFSANKDNLNKIWKGIKESVNIK